MDRIISSFSIPFIILSAIFLFACNSPGRDQSDHKTDQSLQQEHGLPAIHSFFTNIIFPADTFVIDPASGAQLKCRGGLTIQIPENAFENYRGQALQKNVRVRVKNLNHHSDLILEGIPMTYFEESVPLNLLYRGALEISAESNGKQAFLKKDKRLRIILPTTGFSDTGEIYAYNKLRKEWSYYGEAGSSWQRKSQSQEGFSLDNSKDEKAVKWRSIDPEYDEAKIVGFLKLAGYEYNLRYAVNNQYRLLIKPGNLQEKNIRIQPVNGLEYEAYALTGELPETNHASKILAELEKYSRQPVFEFETSELGLFTVAVAENPEAFEPVSLDLSLASSTLEELRNAELYFITDRGRTQKLEQSRFDKFYIHPLTEFAFIAVFQGNRLAISNSHVHSLSKKEYSVPLSFTTSPVSKRSDLLRYVDSRMLP